MTGNFTRAPAQTTHQTPFYVADEKSRLLFEVAGGIDAETATVHAIDILQTAHTVLMRAIDAEQNDLVDAAARLLDMGTALVRACETRPQAHSADEIAAMLHHHPSAPVDAGVLPGRARLDTAHTLLRELRLAGQIIQNALQLMTAEQKTAWAAANEATGCAGEGVTRRHERDAALELARNILGEGEHYE
ncbi:DUF3077 domain-containing protein [Castellaniella sp. S9]|uniref:DUF3077 domain-containing protein n=1 Tax=Castellaniella sp. S9 TaxID=2993652 RepID=UPI0022B4F774|nr:DUF3077 domain-containing protein [Castellaniella sp. S9]